MITETTNSFRAGAIWGLRHYAGWRDQLIAACLDDITQTAWVRHLSGKDAGCDAFGIGKRAAAEYVRHNGAFHRTAAELTEEIEENFQESFGQRLPNGVEDILLHMREKRGGRGRRAAQRDVQILALIVEGRSNAGIALETGLTETSIKTYRARIRRRLAEFQKMLDKSEKLRYAELVAK